MTSLCGELLHKRKRRHMKSRIDDKQLLQLMRNGNTVSEAARKMGVSKGSISRRLKALNIAINRNVTIRAAHKIVDREINALDQLQKINRDANELLDLLMRWNRGEDDALQVLESQVRKIKVRPHKGSGANLGTHKRSCPDLKHLTVSAALSPDLSAVRVQHGASARCVSANPNEVRVRGQEEEITQYKSKDPRELALKAMQEIREQLKLQLEIFQALFDMRAVQQFQAEVLEVIGSVSTEARDEIVRRLTERNALRSTLDLN
jgi:molybdenum-dependent DNA-binding transcriptional regulator ModE